MVDRIDHAAQASESIAKLNKAIEGWLQLGDIPLQNLDSLNGNVVRDTAIAQVHATLALVEQQRIANLIALAGYEHANGSRSYQYAISRPVNEFDLALNEDIKEALGL